MKNMTLNLISTATNSSLKADSGSGKGNTSVCDCVSGSRSKKNGQSAKVYDEIKYDTKPIDPTTPINS